MDLVRKNMRGEHQRAGRKNKADRLLFRLYKLNARNPAVVNQCVMIFGPSKIAKKHSKYASPKKLGVGRDWTDACAEPREALLIG